MINSNRMARRDLSEMRRSREMSTNSGEVKKLIHELQLIDFSMIDTILYLDAYPCSAEALDYYHKLRCEKNKIQAMLDQHGHPMTSQGNTSTSDWKWVEGPWPWELEAN